MTAGVSANKADGFIEGADVGAATGAFVGSLVGIDVCSEDGRTVGKANGFVDGARVSNLEGLPKGLAVAMFGSREGAGVGACVGANPLTSPRDMNISFILP